jgi:hypothetical protein
VILELPIRALDEGDNLGEPRFVAQVLVDGKDLLFELRWSQTSLSWYVTIRQLDETPIVRSRRLVLQTPISLRYRPDDRLPPGVIVAQRVGSASSGPEIGFSELGREVRVYYFSADEL